VEQIHVHYLHHGAGLVWKAGSASVQMNTIEQDKVSGSVRTMSEPLTLTPKASFCHACLQDSGCALPL